ncbi:hypothetical protein ABZ951_00505 [Streptomyces sp. NPDC046215]|uniref:Uncharacterized protein n=1 Tax=Streptomyces stramineus TaxID=173861 RepID=A0ABN0ZP65_9ACTN
MLFTSRMVRGRCPCGAEHAACGPPSTVTPVDIPDQEVAAVGGPLKNYRYVTDAGHETTLKLNAADAELRGLTDDDLVDAPQPAPDDADKPTAKGRAAAPNKARTTAANKAGGGGH